MKLRKKALLFALSVGVALHMVACGPQESGVGHSTLISTALTGGGLRPSQAIKYTPSKGFKIQSNAPRVLMVIANQDFWYADYALPRQALEAQGVQVVVAAASTQTARPHAHSGQGADGGLVTPDMALSNASASDFDAILFVGGWGASVYQYGIQETYLNPAYQGSQTLRQHTNTLIQDFASQGKYIAALCHGVTVLAWAEVNGQSLLAGREVTGWNGPAPQTQEGHLTALSRAHIESNGAHMLASGAVGDPATSRDDVLVDGQIITAEDYRSGHALGQELARRINWSVEPTPTPSPVPTPLPSPDTQTAPLPVLMVIANRDFYYREYAEPLRAFGEANLPVVVAAEHVQPSFPHPGTGETGSGEVIPDIRLDQVQAANYAAIVFVGGWGSSQYQYAFEGHYNNPYYNGNATTKSVVNQLINDFASQDKYVMGICHAASVLAWARIDGVSPLAGLQATGGPWLPAGTNVPQATQTYIELNGGIYVPSRSIGDPFTSSDDVVVQGNFITAEDYDTAYFAGQTLSGLLQEP